MKDAKRRGSNTRGLMAVVRQWFRQRDAVASGSQRGSGRTRLAAAIEALARPVSVSEARRRAERGGPAGPSLFGRTPGPAPGPVAERPVFEPLEPRLLLSASADFASASSMGEGDDRLGFGSRIDVDLSHEAESTLVADVTGDGVADAVIAGEGYSSYGSDPTVVAVLAGDGSGGFHDQSRRVEVEISDADPLAAADLDGDGAAEIVTGGTASSGDGSSEERIVAIGADGAGGLDVEQITLGGNQTARDLVLSDVNGDGTPDAVVSGNDTSTMGGPGFVTVLTGDGNGFFDTTMGPFAISPNSTENLRSRGVQVADVNGDGNQDVINLTSGYDTNYATTTRPAVSVLLGDGTADFAVTPTVSRFGPDPSASTSSNLLEQEALEVGDLDGDGVPDLAIAVSEGYDGLYSADKGVLILSGDGSGGFDPAGFDGVAENNDTLDDAVDTGIGGSNGGVRFEAGGIIGDSPQVTGGRDADLFRVELEAGDQFRVNVDAAEELGSLSTQVRLFDASGTELASDTGQTAPAEPSDSGGTGSSDPFLSFTASSSAVYYVGISGEGNLYDPTVAGSGTDSGVGRYAIAMSVNRPVAVDPVASAPRLGDVNDGAAESLALGDLNGDGQLDLITGGDAIGGSGGAVQLLRGDGSGGFQDASRRIELGVSAEQQALAVGDLDGDGAAEIVTGGYDSYAIEERVVVVDVDGTGLEVHRTVLNGEQSVQSLAVGDLNEDGDADVVVGVNEGTAPADLGAVTILLGDGNGAFASTVGPFSIRASGGNDLEMEDLAVTDVDGDGHLDVVSAASSYNSDTASTGRPTVSVLPGDGSGDFSGVSPILTQFGTSSSSSPEGPEPRELEIGDVDGDGAPDAVLTLSSGDGSYGNTSVWVLLGDGSGGFAPAGFDGAPESNDTLNDAIETGIGGSSGGVRFEAGGVLETGTDTDVFRVELDAGDELQVNVDAGEELGSVESKISILDPSFTEVDSNGGAAAPGERTDSFEHPDPYLSFTAPTGGDYYVRVSGESETGPPGEGRYAIAMAVNPQYAALAPTSWMARAATRSRWP